VEVDLHSYTSCVSVEGFEITYLVISFLVSLKCVVVIGSFGSGFMNFMWV